MIQMDGRTKQLLDAMANGVFDEVLADRVLAAFYASYGSRWTELVKDPATPTDEEVNAVFVSALWAHCLEVVAGHEIQAAATTAAGAARGKVDEDFGGVKPVPADPKGGIGEVRP